MLTNLAKHTESTKQTTTIYSRMKRNRISTNELSNVINRKSEIERKNLHVKNEQSFLQERYWFCLSVHRILFLFFIHKNWDISSGLSYLRFLFFFYLSLTIFCFSVYLQKFCTEKVFI
jgi:hypothetical protein